MQVQSINNQSSPKFGATYLGSKSLSKVQGTTVKAILKELRTNIQNLGNKTLEAHYKKKGYDFILDPYGQDLVTMTAYRGLRIDGTGIEKHATYLKGDATYIGKYDKKTTQYISEDLKRTL